MTRPSNIEILGFYRCEAVKRGYDGDTIYGRPVLPSVLGDLWDKALAAGRAMFDGAETYDNERPVRAGGQAREAWRRILDKPHYALPILQTLIETAFWAGHTKGLSDERAQILADATTLFRRMAWKHESRSDKLDDECNDEASNFQAGCARGDTECAAVLARIVAVRAKQENEVQE